MVQTMCAAARHLGRVLRRMAREAGAVSTEYGLILMLIALAIILAATGFGLAVANLFERASGSIPTG